MLLLGQLQRFQSSVPKRHRIAKILNSGAGGGNVGPGGILNSENGGRTWRCATTPPMIALISATDPLHVWAADTNQSTALRTTDDGGATWHALNLSWLGTP